MLHPSARPWRLNLLHGHAVQAWVTAVGWACALRDALRAAKAERPFRIDAWVKLPDHLHAVWTFS